MIKVTVTLKHNPAPFIFEPKGEFTSVVGKLKMAIDNKAYNVAFDTENGGVFLDPREAVGFKIEKI